MRNAVVAPALLLLAAFTAGCTTEFSARKVMPLDRFQRVFVERRLNDNHRLDDLLVAELRRHGREASSGPLTMMPEGTDAVLTYDARWEWDFKSYLVEFTLELHTARTRKKLADARCYQPHVRARPPEAVARDLIARLLAPP
ncbi:MAG: hypothetical protein JNL39_05485 [Opitutaceae bacterium]|nr:hypothetical protein [Opitutaceae bacterium]